MVRWSYDVVSNMLVFSRKDRISMGPSWRWKAKRHSEGPFATWQWNPNFMTLEPRLGQMWYLCKASQLWFGGLWWRQGYFLAGGWIGHALTLHLHGAFLLWQPACSMMLRNFSAKGQGLKLINQKNKKQWPDARSNSATWPLNTATLQPPDCSLECFALRHKMAQTSTSTPLWSFPVQFRSYDQPPLCHPQMLRRLRAQTPARLAPADDWKHGEWDHSWLSYSLSHYKR